jgi:CRP-like cAMP-binding protein
MIEALRSHIEKIVPLTDTEFEFVASHFTVQNFVKRDFIFKVGDPVPHIYFVVSGLLVLTYDDDSGKQHVAAFAMEDWWESDYHAFYNESKATMSLQCLENTTALRLTLEGCQIICSSMHKMEHFFLEKSNRGHIASQQRILSFLTSDATQRYNKLLKRYPALLQRVPKTLLASYLGVSRETLSRLTS